MRLASKSLFPALLVVLASFQAGCGGAAAPPAPASSVSGRQSAASSISAASSSTAASAKPSPPAQISASAAPSAALTKLRIPYTAISVSNTPAWMPVETGAFKKYGLDVTSDYIPSSTTLTPAMLSGEIPVANQGEDALINVDLNGADLVIIFSGIEKFIFSVYASPKLSSMADLKGKRLGITKIGAATDFAARLVLSKNNLQPDKDVAILQMGGVPEILAGITAGSIDAGILSPPTTVKAKQASLKEITNLADYDIAYYTAPIAAKKSWLAAHREDALNIARAYSEGVATIRKDKQLTMKVIAKYTKTDDQAILEDSYQSLVKALPATPLPKVDAIKTGLQQSDLPAAKTADPNSFIDPSLIEELDRSGFLKSLESR